MIKSSRVAAKKEDLQRRREELQAMQERAEITAAEFKLGLRFGVTHYLDDEVRLEQYRAADGKYRFVFLQRDGERAAVEQSDAEEVKIRDYAYEPLVDDVVHPKKRGKKDLILPPAPSADEQPLEPLFDDIMAFSRKYATWTPEFRVGGAAYVLMSGNFDAHQFVPYLQFVCLQGSGKTQSTLILYALCYHAVRRSSPTPATLFRPIELYHPTLILDEMSGRQSKPMVEVLRAGTDRDQLIPRYTADRDGLHGGTYSPFCPKVLSGQEAFETNTLASRIIPENLAEVTKEAHVPRELPAVFQSEAKALRARLFRYWLDNTWRIRTHFPEKGDSRQKQIFGPLFANTPEKYWPQLDVLIDRQTASVQLARSMSLEGEIARALVALGLPYRIFPSAVAACINEERGVPKKSDSMEGAVFEANDKRFVSDVAVGKALVSLGLDKQTKDRASGWVHYREGRQEVLARIAQEYAADDYALLLQKAREGAPGGGDGERR